jgi:hypothetical protein
VRLRLASGREFRSLPLPACGAVGCPVENFACCFGAAVALRPQAELQVIHPPGFASRRDPQASETIDSPGRQAGEFTDRQLAGAHPTLALTDKHDGECLPRDSIICAYFPQRIAEAVPSCHVTDKLGELVDVGQRTGAVTCLLWPGSRQTSPDCRVAAVQARMSFVRLRHGG